MSAEANDAMAVTIDERLTAGSSQISLVSVSSLTSYADGQSQEISGDNASSSGAISASSSVLANVVPNPVHMIHGNGNLRADPIRMIAQLKPKSQGRGGRRQKAKVSVPIYEEDDSSPIIVVSTVETPKKSRRKSSKTLTPEGRVRQREGERNRREKIRQQAARVKALVPSLLHDAKVNDGIVMEHAADYIEKLLSDTDTLTKRLEEMQAQRVAPRDKEIERDLIKRYVHIDHKIHNLKGKFEEIMRKYCNVKSNMEFYQAKYVDLCSTYGRDVADPSQVPVTQEYKDSVEAHAKNVANKLFSQVLGGSISNQLLLMKQRQAAAQVAQQQLVATTPRPLMQNPQHGNGRFIPLSAFAGQRQQQIRSQVQVVHHPRTPGGLQRQRFPHQFYGMDSNNRPVYIKSEPVENETVRTVSSPRPQIIQQQGCESVVMQNPVPNVKFEIVSNSQGNNTAFVIQQPRGSADSNVGAKPTTSTAANLVLLNPRSVGMKKYEQIMAQRNSNVMMAREQQHQQQQITLQQQQQLMMQMRQMQLKSEPGSSAGTHHQYQLQSQSFGRTLSATQPAGFQVVAAPHESPMAYPIVAINSIKQEPVNLEDEQQQGQGSIALAAIKTEPMDEGESEIIEVVEVKTDDETPVVQERNVENEEVQIIQQNGSGAILENQSANVIPGKLAFPVGGNNNVGYQYGVEQPGPSGFFGFRTNFTGFSVPIIDNPQVESDSSSDDDDNDSGGNAVRQHVSNGGFPKPEKEPEQREQPAGPEYTVFNAEIMAGHIEQLKRIDFFKPDFFWHGYLENQDELNAKTEAALRKIASICDVHEKERAEADKLKRQEEEEKRNVKKRGARNSGGGGGRGGKRKRGGARRGGRKRWP